jgi:hypothetical protein
MLSNKLKKDSKQIYTPTKVKHHPIFLSIYFFTSIPFFSHFLKDYTKGSKITNLRSIYHPERRDYDVAKMGFKTGAGKT